MRSIISKIKYLIFDVQNESDNTFISFYFLGLYVLIFKTETACVCIINIHTEWVRFWYFKELKFGALGSPEVLLIKSRFYC